MRRASQDRTATAQATSSTPSGHSSHLPPARHTHENSCGELSERQRSLAIVIRQRIESRLVGRVRDLVVKVSDSTVVLEGKCSTYYTKQLAQHAALGVLDDEHLENAIIVTVPR